MMLEHPGHAIEKTKRPILMAVAVVAIILLAATAYTFAGSLPATADDGSRQAVGARSLASDAGATPAR